MGVAVPGNGFNAAIDGGTDGGALAAGAGTGAAGGVPQAVATRAEAATDEV